eukprot:TRINITY_DN1967_c0_g2_i1.p1 TRINITY_DN1967_c0_g2~~TRINITY_DN1967_c0_g2_i1.p1  ORF type:complete len:1126 (-),score=345.03 TRINITY_DN1967_c0_g2_i1:194-3571(-)
MVKRVVATLSVVGGLAQADFLGSFKSAVQENVNSAQDAATERLNEAKAAAAENIEAAKKAAAEAESCLSSTQTARSALKQCLEDGAGQQGTCGTCYSQYKTSAAACVEKYAAVKTLFDQEMSLQAGCEQLEQKAVQAKAALTNLQGWGTAGVEAGAKLSQCVKAATAAADKEACAKCIGEYTAATAQCPDALKSVDDPLESSCASLANAEATAEATLENAKVASINQVPSDSLVASVQSQIEQAAKDLQNQASSLKAQGQKRVNDNAAAVQEAAKEKLGAAPEQVAGAQTQAEQAVLGAQDRASSLVAQGQEKFAGAQSQVQQAVQDQTSQVQAQGQQLASQAQDKVAEAQQTAQQTVDRTLVHAKLASQVQAQGQQLASQAKEKAAEAQHAAQQAQAQGQQLASQAQDKVAEAKEIAQQALDKTAAEEKLAAEIQKAKADLSLTSAAEKAEEASAATLSSLEAKAAEAGKNVDPAAAQAEKALADSENQAAAIADKALASADTAVEDDVTAVKDALKTPNALSFHFKGLDFKTADLSSFRKKLLDQFRAKGIPESVIQTLKVQFRAGSIYADVIGDTESIQQVQDKAPSGSVTVDGVSAEVSTAEDLCHDAKDSTDDKVAECKRNVEWAKNTGIVTQPGDYSDFPNLSADSPWSDFQYVLHQKQVKYGSSQGHDCPLPCAATSPEMAEKMVEQNLVNAKEAQALLDQGELKQAEDQMAEAVAEENKEANEALSEESTEVADEAADAVKAATRAQTMSAPQLGAVDEATKDAEVGASTLQEAADEAQKTADDALKALDEQKVAPVEALEKGAEAVQAQLTNELSSGSPGTAEMEAQSQKVAADMEKAKEELEAIARSNTDKLQAPLLEAAAKAEDVAEKLQQADSKAISEVASAQQADRQVGAMAPQASAAYGAVAAEVESTTAQPSEPWDWKIWALIVAAVCCGLPLLGLACSAFICYESVAWIFGGSGKRSPQKKKNRAVKAPARPAMPQAEMTPLMDPQRAVQMMPQQVTYQPQQVTYQPPIQTTVVPTTASNAVMYRPVPAAAQASVAAAAPVSYAPAPVTYAAGPATTYAGPSVSAQAPFSPFIESRPVADQTTFAPVPLVQSYSAPPGQAAGYTYLPQA